VLFPTFYQKILLPLYQQKKKNCVKYNGKIDYLGESSAKWDLFEIMYLTVKFEFHFKIHR
jgi:hypothetical protein